MKIHIPRKLRGGGRQHPILGIVVLLAQSDVVLLERDVVLRPIQYLVLVVVVDVRVLDVLLVRVEVCSDWQQLALAYARPKIAINLLKYLRYLIAIRIRLKYAHDLLVREKQVVK